MSLHHKPSTRLTPEERRALIEAPITRGILSETTIGGASGGWAGGGRDGGYVPCLGYGQPRASGRRREKIGGLS